MIKFKKMINKGFTLIELLLVLGIASLAFLAILNAEQKRQENMAAENSGLELAEIGSALGQYINLNNSALVGAIPLNTTVTLPITALQSATGTTAVGAGAIQNRLVLLSSYQNRFVFATTQPVTFTIYIRNNAGVINALILSDNSIVDKTGGVRYDWAGISMRKAGINAGISFGLATQISGINGTWTIDNTQYAAINAVGLLGYRVAGGQGQFDDTYLRLDGLYPMNGNLNMGNYNIRNATDMSYTGWLYGNNGVMNNLLTGTITNAGNITTQSISGKTTLLTPATITNAVNTTNLTYTGNNASFASFDLLYANCINCGVAGEPYTNLPLFNAASGDVKIGGNGNAGALFVKDIILGSDTGAVVNTNKAYLSDRLPRYADRGIIRASNNQIIAKPVITTSATASGYVCRWTGTGTAPVAKIEVIPASMWVQGGVLGTLDVNLILPAVNINNKFATAYTWGNMKNTGIQTNRNLYSLGAMFAYATDLGASWQVIATTPGYNAARVSGDVLAHIYCDYGT